MFLTLRVSFYVVFLAGCTSTDSTTGLNSDEPIVSRIAVQYPEGDPSVAAEDGGPGFEPAPDSGWKTDTEFLQQGSSDAIKGSSIRYWVRFPLTLRVSGKDSTTSAINIVRDLGYESLLERHWDNLELVPRLATHWSISDDRMTFRYRINPRAHWSDGRPVTAADVVATWDLLMDPTILQPAMQVVYGRYERPRAVSKYIVKVRAKERSWRNFLYFSTMTILPAHEVSGLDGKTYLSRYQFRTTSGSGPYELRAGDVKMGQYLTLRRREDYWGRNERFAKGRFNFEVIRLVSTEDSVLALEKVKKGEIDIYKVGKAKDWASDLPRLDQVRRGLLVMCRVHNDEPAGVSGIVINMRRPPLDDVRIRKALCHLFNRRKLIDKLFYGEYSHLDGYFAEPDSDRELIRYDPDAAMQLLRQAGWSQRDSNGLLVKGGRHLELELVYSSKVVERYLSVFQEDCRKAGIVLHLKQLTRASRFQTTYGNREFQLATQGWGGSIDPNPEATWLSELADKNNNNNLAGFKSRRVDDLCRQYNESFDADERSGILQEIDRLIFEQHPCILGWRTPYIRLLYWNKFGQPDGYVGRTAGVVNVLQTWWIDSEKLAQLKKAKGDRSIILDPGPSDIRDNAN